MSYRFTALLTGEQERRPLIARLQEPGSFVHPQPYVLHVLQLRICPRDERGGVPKPTGAYHLNGKYHLANKVLMAFGYAHQFLGGSHDKTEFMIISFYEMEHLTLRLGHLLFDMLRHPQFDTTDVHSNSIVSLHRQLERPYAETATKTYNLWKKEDGNQQLELVKRDWLDCFREIIQNPEWKKHFDLTFKCRQMFNASGRRLIGPA
jgi:hypothetical protein